MKKTDLGKFNNKWYEPGGTAVKRFLWYFTNAIWINSAFPFSGFKIFLLRLFGASIGKNVLIKPHVNIKYPWRLKVGDHVWIGEYAWIDNIGNVTIGDHVCISQGALLLCGNHNYSKSSFDLIVGDIVLEEGAWIGARSVVCPGTTVSVNAVLTAGSVGSGKMEAFSIYKGNPATKIKERIIS